MPKQNDFVSDIDYSEAQNILNLTIIKQQQKRSQNLTKQLLLKRTYTNVCQLLESECTIKHSLPLANINANKRKYSSNDDHQVPSSSLMNKKRRQSIDDGILRKLNVVKIADSDKYFIVFNGQTFAIVFVV